MARLHAAAFTMPRPWSEAEIADLLASPLCFALTQPQGFIMGRVVAGEAELLTVAVAPSARGQGIGTTLVRRFMAEVRTRGAERVFLEVAETNVAARALYARAGFVAAGRRRGYYHAADGTAVDAVVMTHGAAPQIAQSLT
jgi:[ribosomal protein S18]-alanine N-acetyltransferase